MSQNPTPSLLDQTQILQRAFDGTNDRLRTDAEVTAVIGDIEIDADESDIAIKDRATGNLLHINNDGSIDANVVVSAAGGDSIAISDGTDTMAVNTDGSVNSITKNVLITQPFDYVAASYPDGVTETYAYKTGGAGGTTVGTITVVYTDSSKFFISTVTKS